MLTETDPERMAEGDKSVRDFGFDIQRGLPSFSRGSDASKWLDYFDAWKYGMKRLDDAGGLYKGAGLDMLKILKGALIGH